MFAMQYGFDFPSNFEMNDILARSADIGEKFNALPGLYHKAFLVGGRSQGHANRYTPFYLWQDMEGMTAFLESESFAAVSGHFGRPSVKRWNGIAFFEGAAVGSSPSFAVQETVVLDHDVDLAQVLETERKASAALVSNGDLHTAFVGLDPERWELMRISLWLGRPERVDGRIFDVGYLSRPSQT